MKRVNTKVYGLVRVSRFPLAQFDIIFGGLLLASGLHEGLLLLTARLDIGDMITVHVVLAYWVAVSLGLAFLTRHLMKKTYEEPLQKLAAAASKVARGDFSVYIPPLHSADQYDYLDVMILDFNKMVAELGSMETLKTDFFSNVSHEIKTPLAVIQNTRPAAQGQVAATGTAGRICGNDRKYARRLSDLIGNILKLNKLEKQTIQPKAEPYDLCAQLADCALLFESRWEEKEIDFEADIEGSCCDSGGRQLAGAGVEQPAVQRNQVYRARRNGFTEAEYGRGPCGRIGFGYRLRHGRGDAAPYI